MFSAILTARAGRALAALTISLTASGCAQLRPAPSTDPGTPSSADLLSDADGRLAVGDYEGAADSLETLLDEFPHSQAAPQAVFELAAIYLSKQSPLRDTDRALMFLDEAAADHPGTPLALAAETIQTLVHDNENLRYEEIRVQPSETEALLSEGDGRMASDDPEGAAKAYRLLVDRYPDSEQAPEALFLLASIHLDPETPIYDKGDGARMLAELAETYPDSIWSDAARAILALSRSNIDLRRSIAAMRQQLDELKKIDLGPDG